MFSIYFSCWIVSFLKAPSTFILIFVILNNQHRAWQGVCDTVLSACVLSLCLCPVIPTIRQAGHVLELCVNSEGNGHQWMLLAANQLAYVHGRCLKSWLSWCILGLFWGSGLYCQRAKSCLRNHLFQESELMFEIQYGVAVRRRNASKAL